LKKQQEGWKKGERKNSNLILISNMPNPYLTNKALEKFINGVNISKESKESLLSKVPELTERERIKLFDVLKDVYLLSAEEEMAVEKVKKYIKK